MTTTTGPSAVKCATNLTGVPPAVPAAGAHVLAAVSAARECPWSATSEAAWVQVNPTSGQGDAQVTVAVSPNDTAVARAGAIVLNGTRVTLNQEAAACRFDLDRSSAQVGSDGGAVQVGVATLAGCNWQVSSPVAWVSLGRATGSGSGSVELTVAPNSGAARSVSIQIAGRTFTVSQSAAGSGGTPTPGPSPAPSPSPAPAPSPDPAPDPSPTCTFRVSPEVQQFGSNGGNGVIALDTPDGCAWTASTSDGWITIVTGTGTGSGQVRYTVASNSGTARTGAVTVGGLSVRIEQDGPKLQVSLNGRVSDLSGTCPSLTFTLKERKVFTDPNTAFTGTCTAIANRTVVKIDGREASSGRVYATAVELK